MFQKMMIAILVSTVSSPTKESVVNSSKPEEYSIYTPRCSSTNINQDTKNHAITNLHYAVPGICQRTKRIIRIFCEAIKHQINGYPNLVPHDQIELQEYTDISEFIKTNNTLQSVYDLNKL